MVFLCQNALRTKNVLMKIVVVLYQARMERIAQLYVSAIVMKKCSYVAPLERITTIVLSKTFVMKGVTGRII
jgi:hypothetical protein